MGFISISFFHIFIIIFIFSKSITRNKTDLYSKSIIKFEEKDFRYVNFATNSNGDMVFYSNAYPNNKKRLFYGFKKNGRPFFKNEEYFYTIESKILEQRKFESKIIFIKPNNTCNKEYLMSVGKENSTVEIYDFDKDIIYEKLIEQFSNLEIVLSYKNEAFFIKKNSNENFYLFGFTYKNINDGDKFYFSLQLHKFDFSLENFKQMTTKKNPVFIHDAFSAEIGISCFETDIGNIICFYLTKEGIYNIIVYDTNLKRQNNFNIDSNNYILVNDTFYKCIHLKAERGVFSYYTNDKRPIFLFREYEHNTTKIRNYTIPNIILNSKYHFFNIISLNDIIKLEENKICFSSLEMNRTKIYIVLINLFENDPKYKIRYYSLNLYNIENIVLYMDLIIHKYNNLISLGFSFCNNFSCGTNDNEYYSALMILSYPNSTDKECDLYEYLKNNYNSTINDFSINLENEVRIENNLFGYKFYGIVLLNFENCNNPTVISSLNSNNAITSNYNLKKNETLKLMFKPNNYYL